MLFEAVIKAEERTNKITQITFLKLKRVMSRLKQRAPISQNITNTYIFQIMIYTRDLKQMAHYFMLCRSCTELIPTDKHGLIQS